MTKRLAAILLVPAAVTLVACVETRDHSTRPAAGVPGALRVSEDLARGMRWSLGWGEVSAHDIASRELVRSIALTGAGFSMARESCKPDMLLAGTGALIVSSNVQPTLWRISPARFEVERFDLEVDSDADKDFGFTGLAWGANQNLLHAVSATTGTLWQIDLAAGKASKIALSEPIRGACRLVRKAGGRLPGQPTILQVAIEPDEAARYVAVSPDMARGEVSPASVGLFASN